MRNLKLETIVAELEQNGRFSLEKQYYQHGSTSVYSHSVQVAFFSLYLSRKLKLRVNERALIRGALLHDYFLYDWHDRDHGHSLHGFTHPGTALKNAKKIMTSIPLKKISFIAICSPLHRCLLCVGKPGLYVWLTNTVLSKRPFSRCGNGSVL